MPLFLGTIATGIYKNMYTFKVYNKAGSDVWVIPFENINLSEELNVGVTGNLNINYLALKRYANELSTTPDAILGNTYREWKLYKDDTLFYAGILLHRKIAGSKSQATSYSVNFAGYEALLANRYTGNAGDWAYSATDSADIAWDLIDQTQNDSSTYGDVGITRGLHPNCTDRDRTCRYDNILDVIKKMSNANVANGYDWEMTPLKVFNIYATKGTAQTNLILDDFNIISWTNNRGLTGKIANRVIVQGGGTGDDIVSEMVEDTSLMDDWYLQETMLSEKDTTTSANLTDKGNRLLTQIKEPSDVVSVRVNDRNPLITSYNVGDTLKVKIAELGFNQDLRIDKRTIQIQRSGEAQVDLSFDYA